MVEGYVIEMGKDDGRSPSEMVHEVEMALSVTVAGAPLDGTPAQRIAYYAAVVLNKPVKYIEEP